MSGSPEAPEVSYQQQVDDGGSSGGGSGGGPGVAHGAHAGGHGGEMEWDPEALGQALLTEESEWSAISNLDAFFSKVYTYYVEKGFWCMIAARVTNLITLAFTICFSTFLLIFINWRSLLFCSSSTCDDVIRLRRDVWSHPGTFDYLAFLYFSIFCLYWLWSLFSFFYSLRDAFEMRSFYRDDLRIVDDDLVSLEWHYILDSLVALQVGGRKKLCIVRDLSALDITNRIMRKENYMIAMINLDIFQLGPRNALGVWNATGNCCCANESRTRQKQRKLQEQQQQGRQLKEAKANPAASSGRTYTTALPVSRAPLLGGAAASSSSDTQPVLPSNHSAYQSIGSPTGVPTGTGAPTSASSRLASSPVATAAGALLTAGGPGGGGGKSAPSRVHSGSLASWWSWAMLGTTLEWNLRFCVLNSLFDTHFNVHPSYLGSRGINALKARFIMMGVANLVLSPFILLFMIIFFFLKHAEELHSKRTLFGPRQWCALAQWKIREFNELPHFFERRLTLSSVAAQQYMAQFPNNLVSILAQCVAYMTGAVVGILLLLTVTDSDVITHRLFDRTLLWYLAVFSAVLALSRSMIPDKSIYPAPALVMGEVVKHTHYSPAHWRARTHTTAVYREFSYMYPSRLSMFLYEIMSVLMTPFILIFCLPHSAERIVQFVSTRTVNVQGVGHLCSYAMFDIEKFGDPHYSHLQPVDFSAAGATDAAATGAEAKDGVYRPPTSTGALSRHASTSSSSSGAGGGGVPPPFPLRPKQGKLEKSFLSFSMANPHWRADQQDGGAGACAGGQRFLQSIADTLQGRATGATAEGHSPPMLSRESSVVSPPPSRVGRAAAGGGGGMGASRAQLPPHGSTTFTRQDSLDSSTTDEGMGMDGPDADADGKFEPDDDGGGNGHAASGGNKASASSASYMLSQSDRHLIQSFADLIGMDAGGASALHPSVFMRQSSMGGAGAASTLGMSTMLGLNQRRGAQQQQQQYHQPQRGYMNQSMLMRSQLGASGLHPSNSVLLNSALMPRGSGVGGGGGGLQGGLSASTLLHMDPQSMREQLMLAQADQQADLFALLESRLDETSLAVPEEGDEEQEEDAYSDDESQLRHHHHHQHRVASSIAQAPPAFHAGHAFAQPSSSGSSGARDIELHHPLHASSSPPHSHYPAPSSTDTTRSYFSPPTDVAQRDVLRPGSLQRRVSDPEDNEPPPMSFFEPAAR